MLARVGFAAVLLVELIWSAAQGDDASPWALAPGLVLAACGLQLLSRSLRRTGEAHAWCLPLLLVSTVVGVALAPWGGSLLPGLAWFVTAASMWSVYADAPWLRPATRRLSGLASQRA